MIDMVSKESKAVRILLVEDNPADARALREMLAEARTFEFELREVASMSAAESYLVVERFDVIVLDIFLPDSSGMETYERARSAARQTPILILTGLNNQSFAAKLMQVGAKGYFIKGTVDQEHFIRSIQSVLRKKTERPSAAQKITG